MSAVRLLGCVAAEGATQAVPWRYCAGVCGPSSAGAAGRQEAPPARARHFRRLPDAGCRELSRAVSCQRGCRRANAVLATAFPGGGADCAAPRARPRQRWRIQPRRLAVWPPAPLCRRRCATSMRVSWAVNGVLSGLLSLAPCQSGPQQKNIILEYNTNIILRSSIVITEYHNIV